MNIENISIQQSVNDCASLNTVVEWVLEILGN